METVQKIREVSFDENINEQNFVSIINNIYKGELIIYIRFSNDLVLVNKVSLPLALCFPKSYGYLGYIKNNAIRYIYELYTRSNTIDHLLLSEIDVTDKLGEITKKNIADFYRIFGSNKIPRITIGSDAQWMPLVQVIC